jgi:hypothetical protein
MNIEVRYETRVTRAHTESMAVAKVYIYENGKLTNIALGLEISKKSLVWGCSIIYVPLQGWHSSLVLRLPLVGARFPSSSSEKNKSQH